MGDMSSMLSPVFVAVAMWIGCFLQLERTSRALLMLPFVIAACLAIFWRIPMKSELEPYLGALSTISAASIVGMAILIVRRKQGSNGST
jgi:hypothetical protein